MLYDPTAGAVPAPPRTLIVESVTAELFAATEELLDVVRSLDNFLSPVMSAPPPETGAKDARPCYPSDVAEKIRTNIDIVRIATSIIRKMEERL